MFLQQKMEIEKEILNDANDGKSKNLIEVKVATKEQIFSPYSYSGDKLNSEFCNYIFEKAKIAPLTEDISIKIYANENIDANEIDRTMKSHYRTEYHEAKREMKRTVSIAAAMTLFGVLTLSLMVLLNHFWKTFYLKTIVEIAAWVFVWEATDHFFLQRPLIKAKLLLIQRIYRAKIEIVVNN